MGVDVVCAGGATITGGDPVGAVIAVPAGVVSVVPSAAREIVGPPIKIKDNATMVKRGVARLTFRTSV